MPTCGCYCYPLRVARRKALVARWTAKYRARGLSNTEVERIIQKRLYRERI